MASKRRRLWLTGTLLLFLLMVSGCYKGDGTESRSQRVAVEQFTTDPNAAQKQSMGTVIQEDTAGEKTYPFTIDTARVREPQQAIVLVLIYEKVTNGAIQTVNYYDKNGNVYRYREPLDTQGDWYSVLCKAHATAQPVNRMSEVEQKTLWYLAGQMGTYAQAAEVTQKNATPPEGSYTLYGIAADGTPVPLVGYAKEIRYRKSDELTAFANWFRYFYHGEYRYPTVGS